MNWPLIALGVLFTPVAAAASLEVTHSGRLLDSLGAAMDGEHLIEVSLYGAADGSDLRHDESFTVNVADGYYSVILGRDALDLLDAADLTGDIYVGVSVDSGPEPLPRQRLGSVVASATADVASRVRVDGAADAGVCEDGEIVWDTSIGALRICLSGTWQDSRSRASLITRTTGDLGDRRFVPTASSQSAGHVYCPANTYCDVPNRSVTFSKRYDSSALRFEYADTLGSLGQYYQGCTWRIMVSGSTSDGTVVNDTQVALFTAADSDDSGDWDMENALHAAWWTGLQAGTYTVRVQGGHSRGTWGTQVTECLMGWRSDGEYLLVEEMP